MRFSLLALSVPAIALSACAERSDHLSQGATSASAAACDATLYADLVGEPITLVDTLNTGLNVRILPADGFVTKDYDPSRLTFTTTPDDTVGRVFCG